MGADRAIHLIGPAFDGLDNLGVARALAKAIRKLSFDLILCGRQAVDDDMAQVGPAIAVFLGIPAVAVVTQVDLSEDLRLGGCHPSDRRWVGKVGGSIASAFDLSKRSQSTSSAFIERHHRRQEKICRNDGCQCNRIRPGRGGGAGKPGASKSHLNLPPERKKGRILEGSPREAVATLAQLLRDEERVI